MIAHAHTYYPSTAVISSAPNILSGTLWPAEISSASQAHVLSINCNNYPCTHIPPTSKVPIFCKEHTTLTFLYVGRGFCAESVASLHVEAAGLLSILQKVERCYNGHLKLMILTDCLMLILILSKWGHSVWCQSNMPIKVMSGLRNTALYHTTLIKASLLAQVSEDTLSFPLPSSCRRYNQFSFPSSSHSSDSSL